MKLGHHHPNGHLATGGRRGRHDERGASLVEYALLVALLAIAGFTALSYLGTATSDNLNRSAECITAAKTGTPDPSCS